MSVTLPATVSAENPATVEIPVENLTPGTVAVLVKPDGTEALVKTSTTTENGVALTLDGSATVKLVDNTKTFTDVKGDEWYADNAAWAASREIMNGVGGGQFDADATASRGMIAQLLFNLDGAEATGATAQFAEVRAEDWFADAVAWLAETGVARGEGETFGANDPVTREQLAVMLYNYAKYKGFDVSARADLSRFPDADGASGWAKEALAWAVGVGLINGTTAEDGVVILDAQSGSTRAMVAAIVQRFCAMAAR